MEASDAILIISEDKNKAENIVEFFFSKGKPKKKMVISAPTEFNWKINNQRFELFVLNNLKMPNVNYVMNMLQKLEFGVPVVIIHSDELNFDICPSYPVIDMGSSYTNEELEAKLKELANYPALGSWKMGEDKTVVSPPKDIFIVEDEKVSLKILTNMLSEYNCSIYTFENGVNFLKVLRDKKPDLIILDYYLPDLNADFLSFWARRLYKKSSVPIIIVSGLEEKEIVVALMNYGVSNYLSKPVKVDKLASLLGKYRIQKKPGYLKNADENPETSQVE